MRYHTRSIVSTFTAFAAALFLSHTAQALDLELETGLHYGHEKVRGVNLGGWLVLEPWITPSLFVGLNDLRVLDEWTFGEFVPENDAKRLLRKHWDTFIVEDDFRAIKAAGLNHVRLPIGYWAIDKQPGEPYISGQAPYVNKAIHWARKHGLKVWLDLHGAPGSQNGFDNSGRAGETNWHRDPVNIERSRAIIAGWASQYANQTDVVTAIEVLNEPASFRDQAMLDPLKQYYLDSYESIRHPANRTNEGKAMLVLADAFKGASYWTDFMAQPDYTGVSMDHHIYQMFDDATVGLDQAGHIALACKQASEMAKFNTLPVFVGEWTPATTECAGLANPRSEGSRYDGTYPGSTYHGSCENMTGDASRFSEEYKTTLRMMYEAQTISFEKSTAGWFMWTWKTERAPEWSYKAGLKGGWIPRRPDDYKYPNICDPTSEEDAASSEI